MDEGLSLQRLDEISLVTILTDKCARAFSPLDRIDMNLALAFYRLPSYRLICLQVAARGSHRQP